MSYTEIDRDEARSAARYDTATYRRIGDSWVDVYDVPDKEDR